MVRLKEAKVEAKKTTLKKFQFLNGTIKSLIHSEK